MTIDSVTGGDIIDPDWGNSVADQLNWQSSAANGQLLSSHALTGSFAAVPFAVSGNLADPATEYTITTGTGRITVTNAGTYLVCCSATFGTGATNAGTYVHAFLTRDATGMAESLVGQASSFNHISMQYLAQFTAGQYASVTMSTTGAGTTSVRVGNLSVVRLR